MNKKFKLSTKSQIIRTALTFINKILPKNERILVAGYPNAESNAIEVANYIYRNYSFPVFYVVDRKSSDDPEGILDVGIKILYSSGSRKAKTNYMVKAMTSKYIFLTQGFFLNSFSKRQIVTNIWHGVFYKKIALLVGGKPIKTDITIGTSELTKKMFSEAFGVSENSVFVAGYPRNDILIRSNLNKEAIKNKIGHNLSSYNKTLIWLPTYRKNVFKEIHEDGVETGNPFYIQGFDIERFNGILAANNTLCIVKPHPLAIKYKDTSSFSNLLFIDDKWISDKKLTLYDLVGCSDILISDISSIMIDYLLIDQPIICVSTDFEEYKETRGFYFDDIEEWLPSKVLKNESSFFEYLLFLLKDNADPYEKRRLILKDAFFTFQDANSTERLVNHVLGSSINDSNL